MNKLAIVTTHPIQYNAPLFKLLNERSKVSIKVFYTWGQWESSAKYDPGFAKNIEWDIPLLEGYQHVFVKNVSGKPGSHHFNGIDNPTLIKQIQEWDPDAVLVFGWSFKSHLRVLLHFKGRKKVLCRGDSNLLDEAGQPTVKNRVRRIFLKWVYRHVDYALYVGSANKAYYKMHGLKKDQLIFGPHAIDNTRFTNPKYETIRKELNIPAGEIVFLFAGKFEKKKNPVFLAEAFIKAGIHKAHLLMVGNGELDKKLESVLKAQTFEIQKHIHTMGFQNQSNMPGIYNACDVFILPSQGPGETWGLSVNEAMAASLPVLVSDKCGCHLDLVKDGVNGYLFESGNSDDLIHKMRELASDPARLSKMGDASANIIKDWSFTNIAVAIEQAMDYI